MKMQSLKRKAIILPALALLVATCLAGIAVTSTAPALQHVTVLLVEPMPTLHNRRSSLANLGGPDIALGPALAVPEGMQIWNPSGLTLRDAFGGAEIAVIGYQSWYGVTMLQQDTIAGVNNSPTSYLGYIVYVDNDSVAAALVEITRFGNWLERQGFEQPQSQGNTENLERMYGKRCPVEPVFVQSGNNSLGLRVGAEETISCWLSIDSIHSRNEYQAARWRRGATELQFTLKRAGNSGQSVESVDQERVFMSVSISTGYN
jgi:hypothetical protein